MNIIMLLKLLLNMFFAQNAVLKVDFSKTVRYRNLDSADLFTFSLVFGFR